MCTLLAAAAISPHALDVHCRADADQGRGKMADSKEAIRRKLEDAARKDSDARVDCDPGDDRSVLEMADEIALQVGSIATGRRDFGSCLLVTFSRSPDGIGP
jgi:hypothetical protein